MEASGFSGEWMKEPHSLQFFLERCSIKAGLEERQGHLVLLDGRWEGRLRRSELLKDIQLNFICFYIICYIFNNKKKFKCSEGRFSIG